MATSTLVAPIDPHVSEAHILCHADGHQWRHGGVVGAPDWRPPFGMAGAIGKHSTCTSCGTERARWYTRSGEVMTTYRYPDGYLHKRQNPDDVAPTRLDWRRTIAVRLFDEFAATAPNGAKPKRARKAS